MYRSTIRWTTAAAAAALIALPVAGAAQTTGSTSPQPSAQTQQPPAPQPQPQSPEPATAAQQPPATAEPPAQSGQVDATSAKKHLSEARDTLSQITSMPEAAKLQGDNRTQVSQLISNFNELITTQANWRDAYSKVDANLNSLLGPEGSEPAAAATPPAATAGTTGATGTTGTTGTPGTAGTSGTTATAGATAALDPAIRAKLAEFRTHLKMFEKAAGGGEAAAGAMAPSAATASTSNPANPAATATGTPATPDPTNPSQPPSSSGATGTSGVTPSPTGSMVPMDQAKAAEQVGHAEADKHLDAIDEILTKSKTGTLTKAQTSEVKKHLDQLRALLKQGR